ncbi:MAG: bifunctional hydroxymethylpyrimidine kinase/phosphomethylpyrimidine kinase [Myxococcaceae bacterium]
MSPRVLALAGLEPSGRAGLFADLETARALGAVPLGIATALTAQGQGTFAMKAAPAPMVRRQIAALLELGTLDAVKLGMVPDLAVLRAAVEALRGVKSLRVVDPVVRTSRGERLSSLRPADFLRLAGPLVVLTPNAAEAGWLLGWRREVASPERAWEAGSLLAGYGFLAVVVKGAKRKASAVDVVCGGGPPLFLEAPFLRRGTGHRGTGCRFATALAVGLARGAGVAEAAGLAKAVVRRFLEGVC